MKSVFTALVALGLGFTAQAATQIQSEYFYQADTDNNVLTPELRYQSFSQEISKSKTDSTGQNLNLSYERGLTDMYSVGAVLGYQTAQSETGTSTTDVKGLNDVQIFAKGRYAFVEDSSLHYGADLYFSPSERQQDLTKSDHEVDAATGGNKLTPYVGYQWLLGSHVLGTRLTTDFLLGKRSVSTKSLVGSNAVTTKSKSEGGEETALSFFYEIPHDMGAVGFEAFYMSVAETEVSDTKQGDGRNEIGLGVYSPYRFSETATVIGDLTWSQWATSSQGGKDVDSTSDINVSVSGRFMF